MVIHVFVTLLYGAILPVLVPGVVILALASFGLGYGLVIWWAAPVALLFLTGACALGMTIGALAQSRISAAIMGAILGLFFSIFTFPLPPAIRAWLVISPERLKSLAIVVTLLLLAMLLLALKRGFLLARISWGGGALLMVAALGLSWLSTGIPKQVEREGGIPVCDDSGPYPVCVWPGDEHYAKSITEMLGRFKLLNEYLGGPSDWVIAEIGLRTSEPVIRVRPLGLGAGMWFVAENIGFGISNYLPKDDCSPPSEAEEAENYLRASAVVEVMAGFIHGSSRPTEIQTNDPREIEIQQRAAEVFKLPIAEQLQWIKQNWEELNKC